MAAERFYQGQGQPGEKKPVDVAFLEKWKYWDVAQGVGGIALLFYPPTAVLGLALLASAPIEYAVKNKYIEWRTGKNQKQSRHFAPQAA